jgi:ferredoxin--NADP+ reductase
MVHARQPDVIDAAGWKAIDSAEIARGSVDDRPRDKFTSVPEMLATASAAPPEPLLQRMLAALRGH